jgi:DNA-binding transcriptional LysR family regulator
VIGTDELYFICSPSHEILKKYGREVSFDILRKYPFIQREEGSGTRDIFENKFPNYKNLHLALELNDNDSIITAISESNYISVLSKDIAKKAQDSGLIEILKIKEYPIIAKRNLYFIRLKEKKLTDLKVKFWEYLKNKTS